MNKKILVLLATLVGLTTFAPVWAQQPSKVALLGYLAAGALSTEIDRNEALRQGLLGERFTKAAGHKQFTSRALR